MLNRNKLVFILAGILFAISSISAQNNARISADQNRLLTITTQILIPNGYLLICRILPRYYHIDLDTWKQANKGLVTIINDPA